MSRSKSPSSSAILKAMLSTPSCASVKFISRDEQRSHLRNRGADGVALFAENVPEDHGRGAELVGVELDLGSALQKEVLLLALGADAGKVALDVGAEHRNAGFREPLSQNLQRDCLTCPGCTGDQTMAVAEFQQQRFRWL